MSCSVIESALLEPEIDVLVLMLHPLPPPVEVVGWVFGNTVFTGSVFFACTATCSTALVSAGTVS